MAKLSEKNGRAAAGILTAVFAAACLVYAGLPGFHARRAQPEEIMRGGETVRSAPLEVTPGETLCINTASAQELEALPGIGETLAGRIVAYRQKNGDFAQIEDIMKVDGIGTAKFEAIRTLICV